MSALVLVIALIPVVAADLRRRIIPDRITGPAALVAWACAWALGGHPWWAPPAWGLVVGGPLLVASLARPRGMGMGDAKLAGLIGLALGPMPGLLAVLGGLVVAAAWGTALAVLRRVGPSAVHLPLAPFLAAGVLAVVGPTVFLDSERGSVGPHAAVTGPAVRPAPVGRGDGWWDPPVAGRSAGDGPGHGGRARPGRGAAAPRR